MTDEKPTPSGFSPHRSEDTPPDCDDDPQPQPFPVECLPAPLRDMAVDVATAVQVPHSLTGPSVLGITSAAIGNGLEITSGPQRTTRGNLFILASKQSGAGGSEAFRHLANPLFQFERQQVEQWIARTLPALRTEKDELEAEIAHARKEILKGANGVNRDETRNRMEKAQARLIELENLMQPPVLSCEDITSEKLASLLSKRGEVLASLSSDARDVVNNLQGRYHQGETDEGIYLKAYSGDYCRVDRVMREPVVLRRPCLTVLWFVQPVLLDAILAERSLTEGGLIPRLLPCHTNCHPTPITGQPSGIRDEVLTAYDDLIRTLIQAYRLAAQPYRIESDAAAMRLLTDHFNGIVQRRLTDWKDITSFAARYNEQAWRIAVVLHAAFHGAHAHEHNLSAETARNAIEIADWFADQQLEILEGGRQAARNAKRDRVLALLATKPAGITARDVQRARIAESPEEARTLLDAIATGSLAENSRVETGVKTRVESIRGTEEKILALLAKHPTMSAPELATAVGVTLKGIEWNLARLRRDHRIRHVGPRKGGLWEVLR